MGKFNARKLVDSDYETLVKWWKFWRFPAVPKEYLPEEGRSGIMVSKDGIEICAGFIIFTNSKMAWCEWVVSNFEYREKDRSEALEFLINEISAIAKSKGFLVLFTSVKNHNLVNRYLECGYTNGGKSTELIKVL